MRPGAGVSIVLTDDETIHVYNREYRDVDRATDVLSFPADEGDEILSIPDDFLGDIMISVPRAAEQGAALGAFDGARIDVPYRSRSAASFGLRSYAAGG